MLRNTMTYVGQLLIWQNKINIYYHIKGMMYLYQHKIYNNGRMKRRKVKCDGR